MATADFVAQDDSNFTPIRFYTALDPYFYTVDNRPLSDIQQNLKDARSGGGDSARRAVILNSIAAALSNTQLFSASGITRAMSQLGILKVDGSTVRMNQGSVYEVRPISQSLTDTVMKQAFLTRTSDFSVAAPGTAGTSIVYTVEGQFTELTQSNMLTSTLPYLDNTNIYLPSTLMIGELVLTLNTGTAATSGTETAPTTTAGKFPIYNVTVVNGVGISKIQLHPNAPYSTLALNTFVQGILPSSGAAAISVTNGISTINMIDGSTTGGVYSIPLRGKTINPFKPINLELTFAPTVISGNAVFSIGYKGFAIGDLSTSTKTSVSETVTVTASANAIQKSTLVTTIPVTELAGFVGSDWAINREYLTLTVDRLGADAGDTNTGTIQVLGVRLFQ